MQNHLSIIKLSLMKERWKPTLSYSYMQCICVLPSITKTNAWSQLDVWWYLSQSILYNGRLVIQQPYTISAGPNSFFLQNLCSSYNAFSFGSVIAWLQDPEHQQVFPIDLPPGDLDTIIVLCLKMYHIFKFLTI